MTVGESGNDNCYPCPRTSVTYLPGLYTLEGRGRKFCCGTAALWYFSRSSPTRITSEGVKMEDRQDTCPPSDKRNVTDLMHRVLTEKARY
jgi:hypothetical protein